jgi:thymidylate synthase (FAD)
VSTYTVFYWQQSLRNLLHLLELRLDTHAQWEAQCYAQAVYDLTKERFPWTCTAFEEHTLHGLRLSQSEARLLRDLVRHSGSETLAQTAMASLRPSHAREFLAKFPHEESA